MLAYPASEAEIKSLLLRRAGLTVDEVSKGKSDPSFENLMNVLSDIHRGKEVLYGSYLETHGSEPENFCLVSHFCDMKRKYVRAENIVKIKSEGGDVGLIELLDTYSDLAVYAVMGVQMIIHLQQRKLKQELQERKIRTDDNDII